MDTPNDRSRTRVDRAIANAGRVPSAFDLRRVTRETPAESVAECVAVHLAARRALLWREVSAIPDVHVPTTVAVLSKDESVEAQLLCEAFRLDGLDAFREAGDFVARFASSGTTQAGLARPDVMRFSRTLARIGARVVRAQRVAPGTQSAYWALVWFSSDYDPELWDFAARAAREWVAAPPRRP